MEIRQLRYFVAVAQELQFSKAAVRLGVGQSTVSEQIQNLERDLGVRLFVRTSRSISLTPAGIVALTSARRILDDADYLAAEVKEIATGRRGKLRIGSLGPTLAHVLPAAIKELRKQEPLIDITLELMTTANQVDSVLAGRLDVGFVRFVLPRAELEIFDLLHERLWVILPSDHPLADEPSVSLARLTGETFVFSPREGNSRFYDHLVATCHEYGCVPGKLVEANTSEIQLAFIGSGLGVSIMPRSFREEGRTDVRYVPLADADVRVALQMVWLRTGASPTVFALLRAARKVVPLLQVLEA